MKIASPWRMLPGLGILLPLLVWLCVSQKPTEQRVQALNRALESGAIGHLPSPSDQEFERTVRWLTGGVGASIKLNVNGRWHPDALNVYSVTENARGLTGCGPGNAIYDASIDSIFVDAGLLDASGAQFQTMIDGAGVGSVLSAKEEIPYLKNYLRLVILHELGHRQLHRHTGGYFDSAPSGDPSAAGSKEIEADRFALRHLAEAYPRAVSYGLAVEPESSEILNLSAGDVRAEERPILRLADLLVGVTVPGLFTSGYYSPLYSSRSHPPLLVRVSSLLDALILGSGVGEKLRGRLSLIREMLRRQLLMLDRTRLQFSTPEGLGDISKVGDQWKVFSVELQRLRSWNETQGWKPLLAFAPGHDTLRYQRLPGEHRDLGSLDSWWKTPLWQTPDGTVRRIAREGTVQETSGAQWKESSAFPCLRGRAILETRFPLQPSTRAYVLSSGNNDRGILHVVESGCVASRGIDSILEELRPLNVPEGASMRMNSVSDAALSVEIRSKDGTRYWGAVKLSVPELRLLDSMRFEDEAMATEGNLIVALLEDQQLRFLLVSTGEPLQSSGYWEIATLGKKESKRARGRFPYTWNASTSRTDARRVLGKVQPAGFSLLQGGRAIVLLTNDSVYLVEPDKGAADVVFHPGDEIVRWQAFRDGDVAFFIQGSRTVYVSRF